MTPDEIQSVIKTAMNGNMIISWWAYYLSFFIAGACGFLGAYLKEKGKNLATKEDFDRILHQIELQVSATEKIKADISFSNWKNQELNSIYRKKLEELLICAFELRKLAQDDVEKLGKNLNTEESTRFDLESDSILKMEMLSMLYFPELKVSSLETNINFRKLQQEVMNSNHIAKTLISKELTSSLTPEDLDTLNTLNNKIPLLHTQFTNALSRLAAESEKLLQSLMKA